MNKPLEVRFILDGRNWDEYTEEEQERYRAWVTDRALQISLGPLEERYGSGRASTSSPSWCARPAPALGADGSPPARYGL
jgi:hypothetical protein